MDGTGEAGEAAGKGRARREDRDSRSVARRIFAPIRSSTREETIRSEIRARDSTPGTRRAAHLFAPSNARVAKNAA